MGENKDADQLRGNREADQRLCFRYTDSTFPPLLIPKFSRFWVSSVTVQAGLCWTWSETQIVGFVMHRFQWYSPTLQKHQQFKYTPHYFKLLNIYQTNRLLPEKTKILHMRKQRRRSALHLTAKLISAFVFAMQIV